MHNVNCDSIWYGVGNGCDQGTNRFCLCCRRGFEISESDAWHMMIDYVRRPEILNPYNLLGNWISLAGCSYDPWCLLTWNDRGHVILSRYPSIWSESAIKLYLVSGVRPYTSKALNRLETHDYFLGNRIVIDRVESNGSEGFRMKKWKSSWLCETVRQSTNLLKMK